MPLFHRTTRNVRLTNEGQQLLECARRALLEVEVGLRKIQEAADVQRGRVSLSCSPTIAATRLARVLAAFEQDYPGVEVYRPRADVGSSCSRAIRRHEADFGIGPVVETVEFSFETAARGSAICARAQALRHHQQRHDHARHAHQHAAAGAEPGEALREALEATMRERNLTVTTRYEFTQAQTLISMASAGLGAAILPKVVLPREIDDRTLGAAHRQPGDDARGGDDHTARPVAVTRVAAPGAPDEAVDCRS